MLPRMTLVCHAERSEASAQDDNALLRMTLVCHAERSEASAHDDNALLRMTVSAVGHAIAEKGEIAPARVVRPDLSESVCYLLCRYDVLLTS